MARLLRRYIFFCLAAVTYLFIHEGVHIVQALKEGIYEGIIFNGAGFEVLITQPLTISGLKLALFSGLSSLVTVGIGYCILAGTSLILSGSNRYVKNYMFYTCAVLLLLDPFYISILSFFFGGDIHGIALGLNMQYPIIRGIYLFVLIINFILVCKILYPRYTDDYNSRNP